MSSNIFWIAGLCTLHDLFAWFNIRMFRSYFQRSGERENALQLLCSLNQYVQTIIIHVTVVTTPLLIITQCIIKTCATASPVDEAQQT